MHFPEPWAVERQLGRNRPYIVAASGERITTEVMPYGKHHVRTAEANALRLVACVNACSGFPDPIKAIEALIENARRIATDYYLTAQHRRDFATVALDRCGITDHTPNHAFT